MPSKALKIPSLESLGEDLRETTPWTRRWALTRPFLGVGFYALAVWGGLWWATPLIVFLIFVAIVTVTHDVVHRSLGLGKRSSDWALFFMGAILLESGHAYRTSHVQHHALFPRPDDPEGDPARKTLLEAILCGPLFLPRLWWWSWKKQEGNRRERAWLIAEAGWAFAVIALGIVFWALYAFPWVALYSLLAIVGSWIYPLLTVHLPHRNYGDTPLTQTHTLRGRVIPALFLELTYHLEHHLYPEVPAHNLKKLSKRLDPFFKDNGVEPRKVF